MVADRASGFPLGDEAVDLPVAEQPSPALLHHVVRVAAGGADPGARFGVLRHHPVRAYGGAIAVQLNDNVGGQVHSARPRRTAGAQAASMVGDPGTSRTLAKIG